MEAVRHASRQVKATGAMTRTSSVSPHDGQQRMLRAIPMPCESHGNFGRDAAMRGVRTHFAGMASKVRCGPSFLSEFVQKSNLT